MQKFEEILVGDDMAMYVGSELVDQSEFDFRWVIQIDDHPEREKEMLASLLMIPSPKCTAEYAINDVMEVGCIPDEDVDIYDESADSWWFYQAARYGGLPIKGDSFVHESTYEGEGEGVCIEAEYFDNDFYEAIVDYFEEDIEGINLMSGFFLDRAVNKAGTSGWAWLRMNGATFRQSDDVDGILIRNREDIPSYKSTVPNTLHRHRPFASLRIDELKREDDPQEKFEAWVEDACMDQDAVYLGATSYGFFGLNEVSMWEVE